MANIKVSLMLRVRLDSDHRPYLNPAIRNGKIRAGWAIHEGKEEHFPGANYYLRYKEGKTLRLENVGPDLAAAQIQLRKRQNLLEGVALGTVAPPPKPEALSVQQPKSESVEPPLTLADAAIQYIHDIAARKDLKTAEGYRHNLTEFMKICPGTKCLKDVNRNDVVLYIVRMKEQRLSARTQFNRVGSLHTFFRFHGINKVLEKSSWPRFTEKTVRAFTQEELEQLFKHADVEDKIAIQFFLGTGAREQEAMYAFWSDFDFADHTFTVTPKPEYGFEPKDHESRTVPIPDDLLETLKARRAKHPRAKLIFTNSHGAPEGHFLRRFKKLALKAGLNCGECVNKQGLCCDAHPVCHRWELHALRKTFATMHHDAGVSARTIQAWLGHSDLETTLQYLKAADLRSERTRQAVNNTFGSLFRARPMLVA